MNTEHLETESLAALRQALETLNRAFGGLPAAAAPARDSAAIHDVLQAVAERLADNLPYFHPLYAGQMLKPPHPVARLAYALAQWINPNNHALDGGRASSLMEKEAVAELARMAGWDQHLGHLTSGGTMANLEALWIAGQLRPGKAILASSQAHYTHRRISHVLGLKFEMIDCDARGRLDVRALAARLAQGDAGTVVATVGTTALGAVDPLPAILELRQQHGFRLHVDAAYGGYFRLVSDLHVETLNAFEGLVAADSIVIDPHKHGLQPYGCGCVLFHDPSVGALYKHDSPYTYFTSDELHLGEISLECSRPGAAAVGLWATQRLLPLVKGGEFARMLQAGRKAATQLHQQLRADERFVVGPPPDLDIVVWAPRASSVTEASALSQRIFEAAAQRDLHLALATLPVKLFNPLPSGMSRDADHIRCLRSVLMKPEHLEHLEAIWSRLDAAARCALGGQ